MNLPKCCMDMDIALFDLVFPEHMSEDGQEFVSAHGLKYTMIAYLEPIDLGDGFVKIKHRCAQLGDDGKCKIYATRPKICRDFDCSTRSDCEFCRK